MKQRLPQGSGGIPEASRDSGLQAPGDQARALAGAGAEPKPCILESRRGSILMLFLETSWGPFWSRLRVRQHGIQHTLLGGRGGMAHLPCVLFSIRPPSMFSHLFALLNLKIQLFPIQTQSVSKRQPITFECYWLSIFTFHL